MRLAAYGSASVRHIVKHLVLSQMTGLREWSVTKGSNAASSGQYGEGRQAVDVCLEAGTSYRLHHGFGGQGDGELQEDGAAVTTFVAAGRAVQHARAPVPIALAAVAGRGLAVCPSRRERREVRPTGTRCWSRFRARPGIRGRVPRPSEVRSPGWRRVPAFGSIANRGKGRPLQAASSSTQARASRWAWLTCSALSVSCRAKVSTSSASMFSQASASASQAP